MAKFGNINDAKPRLKLILSRSGGHIKVEVDFGKRLDKSCPRGWLRFIKTCLGTAGLKLIFEEG